MSEQVLSMVKIIHRIGALGFGEYLLANGRMSTYYINLGLLFNFPDLFSSTLDLLEAKIRCDVGIEAFDKLGGMELKGALFASNLSPRLNKPLVVLDRSKGMPLYGVVEPGERILLIDDILNLGLTMKRSVKWIKEEASGVVEDSLVIIDRLGGGSRVLKRMGVRIHRIATIKEVADALLSFGSLQPEEYETIKSEIFME
jgi:orotate phosphoribosyltransferase